METKFFCISNSGIIGASPSPRLARHMRLIQMQPHSVNGIFHGTNLNELKKTQ